MLHSPISQRQTAAPERELQPRTASQMVHSEQKCSPCTLGAKELHLFLCGVIALNL
jgi:hypothetical protein